MKTTPTPSTATALVLALTATLLLAACGESTLVQTAPLGGGPINGQVGAPDNGDGTGTDAPVTSTQNGLTIAVTDPQPGELITTPTVPVKGTVVGLTSVFINGQMIDASSGSFSANVPFSDGGQLVTVSGGNLPPVQIPITVDAIPPTLNVTSPARGQFLVAGQQDMVTVTGRAENAGTGITAVEINGTPATLDENGNFQASVRPVPGANVFEIVARDGAGRSVETLRGAIYGDFAPFEAQVDNAITARLRADAFEVMEDAITQALDSGVVDSLLGENLGGSGPVEIQSLNYGRVDVDLYPVQGALHANIKIYDLRIAVRVEQDLFVTTVRFSGSVGTNPAELDTNVMVDVHPDGSLGVRLANTNVALHAFDLNIDGLADFLEDLVDSLVREIAEDVLMDALNDVVLDQLFDPAMLNQTVDLLGNPVDFGVKVRSMTFDPQGASLAADVGINAMPSTLAPPAPGVYRTPSAPPLGDSPRMARLSMADDLINAILATFWRGGALNINILDLLGDGGGLPIQPNAGFLSALAGPKLLEFAETNTPVAIELRPLLPPLAAVVADGQRFLNVQSNELLIDLVLTPDNGPRQVFATVAIMLDLNIGMTLVDGQFQFDLGVNARADLAAEPLFDIDDATIENGLEGLLNSLPLLLGSSGLDGAFDLGQIDLFGLMLANAQIRRDGEGKDYIAFDVDLTTGP